MEINVYKDKGFTFSQKTLKIIAIIAMFLDHTAWKFLDPSSTNYQVMRFIGRFTMPIMCYFIAEGFFRTKNVYKYLRRLSIFALGTHLIFQYFIFDMIPLYRTYKFGEQFNLVDTTLYTSVFYTLALGLLSLIILKKSKFHPVIKAILLVGILFISQIGDYSYYGVLWVISFGIFHDSKPEMVFSFIIIALSLVYPRIGDPNLVFMYGTFIPIIFILLYNGKKGSGSSLKWFFYLFYPLHLLLLTLISHNFFS